MEDPEEEEHQGPGEQQESLAEELQDIWRELEAEEHQGPGEQQETRKDLEAGEHKGPREPQEFPS